MHESLTILITDDPILVETIGPVVRSIGDMNLTVLPGIEAASAMESWDGVALVILHLARRGPAPEVSWLLRMLSANRRRVAMLVIAQEPDPDQALELLRQGVADYLSLPLDLSRLSYLIDVLTIRGREQGPSPVPEATRRSSIDAGLDAEMAGIEALMEQVRRVAPLNASILLGGETGTGKTRLARVIHDLSDRRFEPFLTINCGSLSADHFEAELFGQLRDVNAGADRNRPGKLAEVGRGTLFLDEVESLPLRAQAKLLRVVEERLYEPVGSFEPQVFRARVIVASSRPLDLEVEEQRFRSDLYYRLNVIHFQIPRLRERPQAIPSLASRFLNEFSTRNGRTPVKISPDALRVLGEYDWPGNVRELRNLIERAVALGSGDEVRVEDLPETIRKVSTREKARPVVTAPAVILPTIAQSTLAQIKRDAELTRIIEALEKHGNNRLRAACELGISRMTLYKKLYKYGLMQPQAASRGGVA